jgi:hypothetical protein
MLEPGIYQTLEAALDRILPGGETGPGAKDACAIRYAEWFIIQSAYRHWHDVLLAGIGLVDTIAAGLHGKPFVLCTDEEKDTVLDVLASVPHPRAQRLMRLLATLAVRGFLSHPKYGGNRDEVGWRYIGFSARYPHVEKGGPIRPDCAAQTGYGGAAPEELDKPQVSGR